MKARTIIKLESMFNVKLSKFEVREIGKAAFDNKESVYVAFTIWVKNSPCKCTHGFKDHETIFEVEGPVNSHCLMEECECEKFSLGISKKNLNKCDNCGMRTLSNLFFMGTQDEKEYYFCEQCQRTYTNTFPGV